MISGARRTTSRTPLCCALGRGPASKALEEPGRDGAGVERADLGPYDEHDPRVPTRVVLLE